MDQDLIAKIANLLKVTFSTLVNKERIIAEQELSAYSKDKTSYFQALLCIISSDMNYHTKNAAGLYLKKFVKECMENEYLLGDEILNWGESIFTQLSSLSTEDSLRANLGYALLPLLSLDSPTNNLLTTLFPHILAGLQASAQVAFGMLKLIQVIFSGYSYNPILFQYFLKIIPEIAGLIYKTFGLADEVKWELLEEATLSLRAIVEHFHICQRKSLIEIQAMPELASMFNDLMEMDFTDFNIPERTLVHIDADIKHVRYNNCKKNVMETINLLIEAIVAFSNSENFIVDNSPLLNVLTGKLEYIIRSIELVTTHTDKDEILQLDFISSLIKELIYTLSHLAPLPRFFYYFSENFKRIAYDLCLPLLQINMNDLEMFEENPEEFVNYSLDLCEKKESDDFKCASARLLLTISGFIDGALSHIWNFAYELVNTSFDSQPPMAEFPSQHLSNEFRAEIGLFTFSLLLPTATNRLDLLQYLEELFRTHLNHFYTAKFLVKARVCLVIKYYCSLLFYNEENQFVQMMRFLLTCCNCKENNSASVNVQASDTLCNVLQDDDVLIRIFSFLPSIFQYLIDVIPTQNNKMFFESVYEMVSTNISVVFPFVDKLVPSLVNKIIQVQMDLYGGKKKLRILIDYSWNVIQCILESKKTQENEALELETYVLPLFEYLKSPKKLYFEDRILQFEVSLIKKCQNVSAAGWNLLELLPHLQSKSNGSLSHLFQFINTLIHIGKQELINNPNNILLLLDRFDLCYSALFSNLTQKEYSEACLLYQQTLLAFKGRLSNKFSVLILMSSQRISPNNKNYFNAKLFGLIFACIISDIESALNSLTSIYTEGILGLIQIFSQYLDCICCNYDLKLTICALCEILRYIRNTQVLKMIIYLLAPRRQDRIQADKGEFTVKIRTKGFSTFEKEESELSIRVSTMFHELSTFDEYAYFKDIMQNIQNNSLEEFSRIIQDLDKEEVDDLTEIIKSKRVQLGNGLNNITEIRKIVKAAVR